MPEKILPLDVQNVKKDILNGQITCVTIHVKIQHYHLKVDVYNAPLVL